MFKFFSAPPDGITTEFAVMPAVIDSSILLFYLYAEIADISKTVSSIPDPDFLISQLQDVSFGWCKSFSLSALVLRSLPLGRTARLTDQVCVSI